jgi:agmatine deiminase
MIEGVCPFDLGLRQPGEWASHANCWIGWPERPDNWRLGAAPAQRAVAQVVAAIAELEPVTVVCSASAFIQACALLVDHPSSPGQCAQYPVRVVELSTDDCWLRDTGAVFVCGAEPENAAQGAGVHFDFNAWGGAQGNCYAACSLDQLVAKKMLLLERLPRFWCPMVLEGGSISVDGEGTALTTAECLLNPNRNPTYSQNDIEKQLRAYLGITKVIWLPYGIEGDVDTSGHVDNMAVFIAPAKVALHWDPADHRCQAAHRVLSQSVDALGRSLEVVLVPAPPALYRQPDEVPQVQPHQPHPEHADTSEPGASDSDSYQRRAGERLAASYVNFYRANGGIIMPGFGLPESDEAARAALQKALPQIQVVQVPVAREILLGGGNIHCLTQQQPVISEPIPWR